MVLGIQILGVLFGLFMAYIAFLSMKRREFTAKETIAWIIVWTSFVIISLVPNSLDFFIKDVLNVGRTLDFFVILGLMFIIAVTFYNYTLIRKVQVKIEDVIRKFAIEEAKR